MAGVAAAAIVALAVPAAAQDSREPVDQSMAVPVPPADANLPEVEPVITQDEFETAVPSLDPETDADLQAPLESIAEFERRLASEQAASGTDAPGDQPAVAEQGGQAGLPDIPVADAELAAPLPPLESFDVVPVEFADEAVDSETVEVAYTIQLDGLDEADEATETGLRSQFNDLSALRDGDGEAANVAQIAARLTEDSALIQRILAAEGWYQAQATTRIDQPETDGGALNAVIVISPGARYTFSDIVIDAPAVTPEDLIRSNLALQVGEPIVAQRVQGAEANVAVALPQNGYPFAEFGQRDILLDPETQDGVYTLPITPGPRSVFGGIRTTGDLAFDADHIAVLARFDRDELYDSRKVDDLRQALVATGLFNTVSVVPEQSGEAAADGTQYATILVDQQAGPPRTLAGSAGFGTGQGFRVEGSWTHRNLFPPEGALIASAVAGTQEQGLGVTFRRSNAGQRDRTVQLSAEALHSNYDAFEAFTGRVAGLVTYASTPIWQKRLTYAYGAQIIGTNEQDFNLATGQRERRTFFIGGLTGQVGLDTTNDLLDPVEGFRFTALVEPEGSLQDGFTPYVRARLDGSAYLGLGDNLVVAGRVRLGTIQGIDRFDLAPSRRFYAGGGGSVRGFGFQQLGPRVLEPNPAYPAPEDIEPGTDPEDLPDPFIYRPLGGLSQFETAAEVRYRFGNFGVVAFVDAGQVYEESLPQFSDIRFGAGIGGRFYTNFGPLRLDLAMPLDRREGESRFAVYVSIGQAF
jgi:translocation and assembly module TamA